MPSPRRSLRALPARARPYPLRLRHVPRSRSAPAPPGRSSGGGGPPVGRSRAAQGLLATPVGHSRAALGGCSCAARGALARRPVAACASARSPLRRSLLAARASLSALGGGGTRGFGTALGAPPASGRGGAADLGLGMRPLRTGSVAADGAGANLERQATPLDAGRAFGEARGSGSGILPTPGTSTSWPPTSPLAP